MSFVVNQLKRSLLTAGRAYSRECVAKCPTLRTKLPTAIFAERIRCFYPVIPAKSSSNRCIHTTIMEASNSNTDVGQLKNMPTCTELKGDNLVVVWKDLDHCEYPLVWLRDNCYCESCYNKPSQSRVMLLADLNPEIKAELVRVEGDNLEIVWEGGHVSTYPYHWLFDRRFSTENQINRRKLYGPPVKTWDSSIADELPVVEFDKLLSDEREMYKWLVSLESLGIAKITGAPCSQGQLHRIGEKVAFLRRTNYGQTFQVKSKVNPSNAAYTGGSLGLHTDLAYYYYQPGMQMLHCIAQIPMEGGENQFSDGFHAANQLKEEYPEYFKTLTEVIVDYFDIGVEDFAFHQLNRMPIISHDDEGNLGRITFSNHGRDSFTNLPLSQVKPFYLALTKYNELLYRPENLVNVKLDNGDIICLHNFRVLHGRKGWKAEGGGERHLEGGYIDWDEMKSYRRVLQTKLEL